MDTSRDTNISCLLSNVFPCVRGLPPTVTATSDDRRHVTSYHNVDDVWSATCDP